MHIKQNNHTAASSFIREFTTIFPHSIPTFVSFHFQFYKILSERLFLLGSFVYWTDWGIDERIEKADMDGRNRVTVIDSGLYYPNGLALDFDRNWLYWIDGLYERLEVYEFPTNTRRQVISSHVYLSYPFGLALNQNHLYWTSQYYYGIYRADRQNGGNVVKILSTESQPQLIHAYDVNNTFLPGI